MKKFCVSFIKGLLILHALKEIDVKKFIKYSIKVKFEDLLLIFEFKNFLNWK